MTSYGPGQANSGSMSVDKKIHKRNESTDFLVSNGAIVIEDDDLGTNSIKPKKLSMFSRGMTEFIQIKKNPLSIDMQSSENKNKSQINLVIDKDRRANIKNQVQYKVEGVSRKDQIQSDYSSEVEAEEEEQSP